MLKILRLSHDQARAWRQNQLFLVDADNKIVRPASREETDEWSRYQELGHDLQLELDDKRVVTFCSARAMLKSSILAEHGDTQIRWPNGIIVTTVRDPNRTRVTPAEQAQSAPSPSRCECVNWGEPHPGRHHAVCQWNRYAPESERGDVRAASFVPGKPVTVSVDDIKKKAPMPTALPLAAPANARIFAAPIAPPMASILEPNQCECRNWNNPDGTPPTGRWGHHPICAFHDAWLALHPQPTTEMQETPATPVSLPPTEPTTLELENETPAESKPSAVESAPEPYYLCQLDSKEELRPALGVEIEESQKSLELSGTPTVVLDGITYLVATRSMLAALPT